jgi:DNA-binding CsgD family transcriptional regulator
MADATTLTEKQQRVYDLIRKGRSRDEIARELDIGTGPLGSIIAGIKRKGALDAQGQPLKPARNGNRAESSEDTPRIADAHPGAEPLDGIVSLVEQNGAQLDQALTTAEVQQNQYAARRKDIADQIARLQSEDGAIEEAQAELRKLTDSLAAARHALLV